MRSILRRLVRRHTYLVYRMPCMQGHAPAPQPGDEHLVLHQANIEGQTALCTALKAGASDAGAYLDDVHRGRIVALVIRHEGDIAHHSYVFLRNKTACILGLGADTALVGNDNTIAAYRGRGYQPRSVALRAAIAAQHGFRFIAAETSVDNLASQRGLAKGGMTLLGRMDLVVVLNCIVIRWRRPPGFAPFGLCLHG